MIDIKRVERLKLLWLSIRDGNEKRGNKKKSVFAQDMFDFCASVENMMAGGWGDMEAENFNLRKRLSVLRQKYERMALLYRSRGGDPSLVDSVGNIRTAKKYLL